MSHPGSVLKTIALILVLAGCSASDHPKEPIRLRLVVLEMDRETSDGRLLPGERIEAAEVALLCPDSDRQHLGKTDKFGRFLMRSDDPLARECSLEIEHPDYFTRIYLLDEILSTIGLSVRLKPRGTE